MNPSIDTNLHHLRTVIRQHKSKPPVTLEKPPVLSHGWLLPYLLEADLFLWQRWQHWYETALAGEVVAPIPIIEWQKTGVSAAVTLALQSSAARPYGINLNAYQ